MLNTTDIKKLEEYFVNYEDLKMKKELRKLTLLKKETDDNVGTKSTAAPQSPVENEVVKLSMDRHYNNIDTIIKAIDEVYKHSSDIEKTIIECRYWKRDYTAYEWEDIAEHLTRKRDDSRIISRNATLNARNKMLEEFAKLIGWVV